MRKNIFWFLLFLSCNLSALEDFDIKWNIGNIGLGINNFQNENYHGNEVFVDLLNIGIQHNYTRIGLEYSPAKYWSWEYFNENNNKIFEKQCWSFINLNLYWNTFDIKFFDEKWNFYFGPFTGINYMYVSKFNINWNDYIYSAGLRIGLAMNFNENIYYNILGGEIGYRNFDGKNTFYFCIKVDLLIISIIFFSSLLND